uniref:Secreted protein n=1 Tax=Steinernema glaseri TaxID=37863 RepID=A0A1I7ZA52_9BILA
MRCHEMTRIAVCLIITICDFCSFFIPSSVPMDTVPSAFVFSLMETLLTTDKVRSSGPVKELGRGYGRIARQVYEAATTCSVETPGVFFKSSCDEDRVFLKPPVFNGMLSGDARSPPRPVKNLVELSVRSQSLFSEGDDALLEGTSIREIRRLMEKCRHVPI